MIRQIKESSLYVKDLKVTREFYEKRLGFKVIAYVSDRHVFFRVGTSVLLCFLAELTMKSSTLPSHGSTGSIHLAFEVPTNEYNAYKKTISDNKIPIIAEHDWGRGLQSFYFRDPDDHLLEIVPEGLWDY